MGTSVKNDVLKILIHLCSPSKELPFLYLGDEKFLPSRDLTVPESRIINQINSTTDGKSKFLIYKIPVEKLLAQKCFSLILPNNQKVYLDYVNNTPIYNSSYFIQNNKVTNIINGTFYCLSKFEILKKILATPNILNIPLYILEYINPFKFIWLFSENEGANDNAYELFKYTVDHTKRTCYYIGASKDIIEDKYKKHFVLKNSIKHYIVLNCASKLFTSFTYLEALPSHKMETNRFHLSFINPKWYLIPHGMYIDKICNIIHSLFWGNPEVLYSYNNAEMDNWSKNSEMTNIHPLGFPRFKKWLNVKLDYNLIFMFFTWRQEFSLPSFTLDNFCKSKYYEYITCIISRILKELPNSKIIYAFHHEIVRHGFDTPINEFISKIDTSKSISTVYFNTRKGIDQFNSYFLKAKYLVTDISSVAYDFASKHDSIVINFVKNDFIQGHYVYKPEHEVGYIAKDINSVIDHLKMKTNSAHIRKNRQGFYLKNELACENILTDCCVKK